MNKMTKQSNHINNANSKQGLCLLMRMTMAVMLLLLAALQHNEGRRKLTVFRQGPEPDDCRGFTPERDSRERWGEDDEGRHAPGLLLRLKRVHETLRGTQCVGDNSKSSHTVKCFIHIGAHIWLNKSHQTGFI